MNANSSTATGLFSPENSHCSGDDSGTKFLTDRMLGTLTKYLRFMGYDTLSADVVISGNSREDSILLKIAEGEGRILLTRDRELAERGEGISAVHITSDDVFCQLGQIIGEGLISGDLKVRMKRCTLCNTLLRPARPEEIDGADYAPFGRRELRFCWCPRCRKLYWAGTHLLNLEKKIKAGLSCTGHNSA
ncbi:Mut7-C RNAse domain-containing protein [Methanoplanus endosymbiosus]|uniref:Mut7-C RNAse domain-containing protein n=1 Tax=Methanoplanus endosymbiosus TaxID=33865 RepID=A0A9E7PNG2_9EURY|nr:Mut7-C RNAse domain-containing protein [Methanoplanus endosymbiosus]UUX91941.1 Mut7-C RNAse domain-containing protein [Methanoplanus endosymbiosus]